MENHEDEGTRDLPPSKTKKRGPSSRSSLVPDGVGPPRLSTRETRVIRTGKGVESRGKFRMGWDGE